MNLVFGILSIICFGAYLMGMGDADSAKTLIGVGGILAALAAMSPAGLDWLHR